MNEALASLAQDHAYHRPFYVWAALAPFAHFGALWLFIRFVGPWLYPGSERASARLATAFSGVSRWPLVRTLPATARRLWRGDGWGTALLFTWGFVLFWNLLFWPVGIYLGFFHERRFGMWHASLARFLWEGTKAKLISSVALSFLTFGLYGLARRLERWWLVLGITAAMLLWIAALADPYRAAVHHAQNPLPQGPLRQRLERLLQTAHVEFKDLVVETTSDLSPGVQAYFAGQGPTRRIVLTDSLVAQMSVDEIEAVVAHEAGHVHERRWPGRVSSSVAMVLFLYLVERLFRVAARRRWLGIESRADVRTLPLVMGVFSLLSFGAEPIVGWFSRDRELAADLYAITLTQNPEAFERMLIRAGQLNRMDPKPPAFFVWMGTTHPPLEARLRALSSYKTAKPSAERPYPPLP